MPDSYQKERYSSASIRVFVERHTDRLELMPLTTEQIQQKALFQDRSEKPEGPLDLLYTFKGEPQHPALGFQQVDGEQDEEAMYLLIYLDPSLKQAWKDEP